MLTQIAPFFIAVAALLSLALSVRNTLKGHHSAKALGTRGFNDAWASFNQLMLTNDDLLEFDRRNHPFGELSKEDARKVYYYFMRFGVAYSAVQGRGLLHRRLADSALANEANLSFHDRDFIRKHVLPRGYDLTFRRALEDKWLEIKTNGTTIPMRGDYSGLHSAKMPEQQWAPLEDK